MKKFLGTTMLALITIIAFTQPSKSLVQGTVTESSKKAPVSGAIIRLGNRQTLSDEQGRFNFGRIAGGSYELTVNSLGYKDYSKTVTVGKTDTRIDIGLTISALFLQPLEIKAVRASDKAPFARTNLVKEEIRIDLRREAFHLLHTQ